VVARVCLSVVAVLAAAWLGLSLRNDQLVLGGLKSSVFAAAVPAPGPARDRFVNRAVGDLRDAQLLNPDRTPAVYEALVRSAADREAGARELARLARSYPQDALIWAVLLRVVSPQDPRAAEARTQLRILIPQRPR
jgi:hypothetical protein